MKGLLFIVGGVLLVLSAVVYAIIKTCLKSGFDDELDDYYFEL